MTLVRSSPPFSTHGRQRPNASDPMLDTLRADVRGEIAQAVATLTWRLAFVQATTIAAVGVLVRLLLS